MSFELRPQKPLQKEFRKLIIRQIDGGIDELDNHSDENSDEIVHETRKRMKRIRGTLRLLRGEISRRDFVRENQRFRDIARPLTHVRDARILLDTFNEITSQLAEDDSATSFDQLRSHFQSHLKTIQHRVLDEENAFMAARSQLKIARERVKHWLRCSNDWSAIEHGYRRTYAQARRTFRAAIRAPDAALRHEWRKQVKHLGFQVELLRPMWPDRLDEVWQELDQMGKLLGVDHDFAVMRDKMKQWQDDGHEFPNAAHLTTLLQSRQREQQSQATSIGERFFAKRPKAFLSRMKFHWKNWRPASVLKTQ